MGFFAELKKATKEANEEANKRIAERKKREAEEQRIHQAALKALWDEKHKNDKR